MNNFFLPTSRRVLPIFRTICPDGVWSAGQKEIPSGKFVRKVVKSALEFGKKNPSYFYHPPLQRLGWRPGWKDCCCGWALAGPAGDPKNALLRGVLCCRLCLTFTEKTKQAWKEVARHPQLSAGSAGPAGEAQEEHLLLLRNARAAGLLLEHMYVLVCICIHTFGLRMSADSTTPS